MTIYTYTAGQNVITAAPECVTSTPIPAAQIVTLPPTTTIPPECIPYVQQACTTYCPTFAPSMSPSPPAASYINTTASRLGQSYQGSGGLKQSIYTGVSTASSCSSTDEICYVRDPQRLESPWAGSNLSFPQYVQ